jgi:hypothetical protein
VNLEGASFDMHLPNTVNKNCILEANPIHQEQAQSKALLVKGSGENKCQTFVATEGHPVHCVC